MSRIAAAVGRAGRRRHTKDTTSGAAILGQAVSCDANDFKPAHAISRPQAAWLRTRASWRATVRALQAQPSILIWSTLLFALVMALGIWAVWAGAEAQVDALRREVRFRAEDNMNYLHEQMGSATYPVLAISMFVRQASYGLNAATFVSDFQANGKIIMDRLPQLSPIISNIAVAPAGKAKDLYPIAGNQAAVGHNLLCDSSCNSTTYNFPSRRTDTMLAITRGELTVTGPTLLKQGFVAIVGRAPIFVPYPAAYLAAGGPTDEAGGIYTSPTGIYRDAAFGPIGTGVPGSTEYAPFQCGSACYNSTHFLWGISAILVNWDKLKAIGTLDKFRDSAYVYRLVATSAGTTTTALLSGSNATLVDGVEVEMDFFGSTWKLTVLPKDGWTTTWAAPVYAAVVLVAITSALMLLFMLTSQRQHYALLTKMLPPKVVASLHEGRQFIEKFETVTILFSDIVSYTTLAASLSPEEVVAMLNHVYGVFDNLCEEVGVYKVETIGDGFMAVCGAPDACAGPEAADKVARLALRMIAATKAMQETYAISIRVGLHSGPVIAAVVGNKMPRYAFFGDTVNTASRMESNGEPMRAHLSAATYGLLLDSARGWQLQSRGVLQIKGKGSMQTFFLNGQAPEGGELGAAEPEFVSVDIADHLLMHAQTSIFESDGDSESLASAVASRPAPIRRQGISNISGLSSGGFESSASVAEDSAEYLA